MPHKDPEAGRAARRRHYAENKEQYKERAAKRTAAYRARLHTLVALVKNRPCADCDHKYPPYVMDFDHVRGEKIGNVATMVNECVKEDVLLDEIEKCEIVCANCHRIRTHERRQNPEYVGRIRDSSM